MKAKELRGRDREELRRELEELRKHLFDAKFQWQAEENPDTSKRVKLRRDMARYRTVLREMELLAEAQQPSGEKSK